LCACEAGFTTQKTPDPRFRRQQLPGRYCAVDRLPIRQGRIRIDASLFTAFCRKAALRAPDIVVHRKHLWISNSSVDKSRICTPMSKNSTSRQGRLNSAIRV
jgi:hypothetical protein